MRAILIDSVNETVKEVKTQAELQDIYDLIGCSMIEAVYPFEKNRDCLYVDEESLFSISPFSKFFLVDGYPQPICGNGLIIGTDEEGNNVSASSRMNEISVKFLTLNQARAWAIANG